MAFVTLRVPVLLVISIGLQHTVWSQSLSGDTDCPSPITDSVGGRDVRYNQCPASNFRVFTDPDLQDLAERLPPHSPEVLAFAARSRESHVVRLTRSAQLGIAQEGAGISIDCLPWLSRFPGGSIQWKYIQLDEFGNPFSPQAPQILTPDDFGSFSRISVGGESNRWLNISSIVVIGGGEDPDSKIFMCEVCLNRSTPAEECYTANYTSQIIGAPPYIINGTSPQYIDVRSDEVLSTLVLTLDCDAINDIPRPVPSPSLSWFKDGQLVLSVQSFNNIFNDPIIEETFLAQNPILMPGVFDVQPLLLIFIGDGIHLSTRFTNITNPMLGGLVPDTTLPEARQLVLNTFLGNWTCLVNNSLGSASVEYIISLGESADVTPPLVGVEVGWEGEPLLSCDDKQCAYFLKIGVMGITQLLSVERFSLALMNINESVDLLACSRPDYEVVAVLRENGIANDGNRTAQLSLVPSIPLDQDGILFRENISLTILDLDRVSLSFSHSEYTVSESDSTFLIQLNKNKPLANPLEVGVAALTLEEAYYLGCIPFYQFEQAEVDEDFRGTSYFSSRATFAADDEGEVPTNQLNISIPLIIDDVIAENQEMFVLMIELRPLCESGALFEVQEQCSLVHIMDDDGCGSDTTRFPPLDLNFYWPPTLKGHRVQLPCRTSSSDGHMINVTRGHMINVTRVCSEDGQWLEPIGLQDCYDDNVNELFDVISAELLNQTSLGLEESALLASQLNNVTKTSTESGAGQNDDNLAVVEEAFDLLAQSNVNEQVVEDIISVLDHLSDWQRDVLQKRSANIVQSFEAITANLSQQMNFTRLMAVTEDIIFHTEKGDTQELLENGRSVSFNTMKGVSLDADSDSDISRVSLPPSLFQSHPSLSDQRGLVFTSYSTAVLFPLTQSESTNSTRLSMIGSSVLAATVVSGQSNAVRNLTEPVVAEFRVNRSMLQNATLVQCVSWDFEAAGGRGNWTGEGCQAVLSESDDKVRCHCNHLTNFAILVEICVRTGGCGETNQVFSFVLRLASIIGVCLSIGGLMIAILTQLMLIIVKSRSSKERERQSATQYKFYLQLCLALLGMYIVFLAGINRTHHFIGCVVASVLLHYLTLAAVLWMSAICSFLFWIMVVNPFAKAKFDCRHMTIVTLICWAIPVIPVIIPVSINRDFAIAYSNGMPRVLEFCFIKDPVVFFAAFIGPVFLLVVTNAVMFICITFVQLRYICCTRRQRAIDSKNDSKSRNTGENFMIVLKLWCILCLFGLTWLFGALTITRIASLIFSTLFTVFTSLQGFFIFIFLCILSKDALRTYKRILCCKRGEASMTSESGQKSGMSQSTKVSSVASKDFYQSYKSAEYQAPAGPDDAVKMALAQELSTKVKLYEQEVGEEVKTSTFKAS